MSRNFMGLLQAQQDKGHFVCIGLDTDPKNIPRQYSLLAFNQQIVDATADFAGAYIPNLASYHGVKAKEALITTIEYIWAHAPNVPIILDAKQGDTSAFNRSYVVDDFDYLGVDAITIHPNYGLEAIKPFLDQTHKGIIVSVRTGHPGSNELQDVECTPVRHRPTGRIFSAVTEARGNLESCPDEGWQQLKMPYYQFVAHRVCQDWNYNSNLCLMADTSNPAEIAILREIAGEIPILFPNSATPGVTSERILKLALNSRGQGVMLGKPRGIMPTSLADHQLQECIREIWLEAHNAIQGYLETTQ